MMVGVVVCAIQCVDALRTQNRIAYNESGFSMALATIGIAGCAAFATVCALIDFGRTRHVWRWWTYTFVLAVVSYVAVRVAASGYQSREDRVIAPTASMRTATVTKYGAMIRPTNYARPKSATGPAAITPSSDAARPTALPVPLRTPARSRVRGFSG